jgi:hypothetical protein
MTRWTDDKDDGRPTPLSTAKMVGYLITIATNSDDHTLAWNVFSAYRDNRNLFAGDPDDEVLVSLVTGCLAAGELENALGVVQVMSGLEMVGTGEAAGKILASDASSQLSQAQKDMLATM